MYEDVGFVRWRFKTLKGFNLNIRQLAEKPMDKQYAAKPTPKWVERR